MARRSKRSRDAQRRGSQPAAPPPFPFPEGPRGFRLKWLNATDDEGDQGAILHRDQGPKIGQFTRLLPEDMVARATWIQQHIKGKIEPVPVDWCAPMWHGLHQTWQTHRQLGIQGFISEQIELAGGVEDVRRMGGLWITAEPLPKGRRIVRFPEPHILLLLCPDGEFCRVLATEYWGPVALGVKSEKDFPAILGPVSVGIMGTVLVDGKPHNEAQEREPTMMLLDPLTVIGDFGTVDREEDGVLMYARGVQTQRLYAPQEEANRRWMSDTMAHFLDLWPGQQVPGYTGEIGMLRRKLDEFSEQERREAARMPVNPQYMEALERQLETARFMHANRPIATVRRQMRRLPHPVDYDAIVADALESATTHYWTAHMCDLLTRSYPNLPEWWLRPEEVGPRRGYCWFATPIPLVEGDPEKVRALLWHTDPQGGGYLFVPFTIFEGPGSERYRTTFQAHHGVPRQAQLWREGQSLTDWLSKQAVENDLREATYIAGVDAEMLLKQRTCWARVFATAIAIMNQVLIKVEPYGADRTTRRRIDRLRPPGLEPPAPIVRAVLLRRQYTVQRGDKEGAQHVDWQHQWRVTEHWRQQWYPSLNQHKWILILEHIKGPPGKPLKTPLPLKIVGR